MRIRNVVHKGVRRFIEDDDSTGLQPATIEKVRRIVSFLQAMADAEELRSVPVWRAHLMRGRGDAWSLHVTRNWRLTFGVEQDEIVDLNFEDYH